MFYFSLVLPFGFGKRACPGKRLAEVELYIITAKFFHAFNVQLVDQLQVEFNFLLTPVGPLKMQISRRQCSKDCWKSKLETNPTVLYPMKKWWLLNNHWNDAFNSTFWLNLNNIYKLTYQSYRWFLLPQIIYQVKLWFPIQTMLGILTFSWHCIKVQHADKTIWFEPWATLGQDYISLLGLVLNR